MGQKVVLTAVPPPIAAVIPIVILMPCTTSLLNSAWPRKPEPSWNWPRSWPNWGHPRHGRRRSSGTTPPGGSRRGRGGCRAACASVDLVEPEHELDVGRVRLHVVPLVDRLEARRQARRRRVGRAGDDTPCRAGWRRGRSSSRCPAGLRSTASCTRCRRRCGCRQSRHRPACTGAAPSWPRRGGCCWSGSCSSSASIEPCFHIVSRVGLMKITALYWFSRRQLGHVFGDVDRDAFGVKPGPQRLLSDVVG